jgi:hypothetical protein
MAKHRNYRELFLDKPFDVIDRLFQTDRASMRGLAVIFGAIGILFYFYHGVKEVIFVSVFWGIAMFLFVCSFLNERGRDILVGVTIMILVVSIFLRAVVF